MPRKHIAARPRHEGEARNIPFARFLASCSGVKLATPRDPGIVFLFFGPGPVADAGVECWDPSLSAASPVLTSMAGRVLLAAEPRPEGAGDAAAVMRSLPDMLWSEARLKPGETSLIPKSCCAVPTATALAPRVSSCSSRNRHTFRAARLHASLVG